ncbi:MAG: chemotaxis protein CheW [Bryobacterales bacterium]|nr:chemotaxis protein CheW [Bryobacterales bacterium]
MIVLTFRIASYWCALRAEAVREIVPLAATCRVPGQPEILEGFLNLRGTLLPVVRLAVLFGLPCAPMPSSLILIVKGEAGSVGLLVDEVESVTSATGELRRIGVGHTATEYAEGELAVEGRNVALLGAEQLLLGEERRRIRELQGQVQVRLQALAGS